jgi:hypothetical protein
MPHFSEIRKGQMSGMLLRKSATAHGLRSASPLPAPVWEGGSPSPAFPPSLFELGRDKAGLGENLPLLRFEKCMNYFSPIQHTSAALPVTGILGSSDGVTLWLCHAFPH